jgi:exocyst complex component 4
MEGLGHNSSQRLSSATTTDVTTKTVRNPESDSFSYIENLLESLTVLGRLVSGLDIVAQRLPVEIFTLVETTIDEVSERLEFNKRMSTSGTMATAWTTGIFIMSNNQQPGTPLETTSLRLAALESSSQEVDHEILRDFFWTLYSKLDAVIQSLRVVFEISNRIGSVSFHVSLRFESSFFVY